MDFADRYLTSVASDGSKDEFQAMVTELEWPFDKRVSYVQQCLVASPSHEQVRMRLRDAMTPRMATMNRLGLLWCLADGFDDSEAAVQLWHLILSLDRSQRIVWLIAFDRLVSHRGGDASELVQLARDGYQGPWIADSEIAAWFEAKGK